ncbi:MAG: thioesterase family protein [Pseudomonadota bacterium]
MNLYLRLLLVFLKNLKVDRTCPSRAATTSFRVLPHDIDALGHLNNGGYFQIMDVARVDWMLRTGVLAAIRRHRWTPVLGGGVARFRFSLRLFQPYRVLTRLLSWDDRWFFLEHVFLDRSQRCVAAGVTRAAMRSAGAWVNAAQVAGAVAPGLAAPPPPKYLKDWIGFEQAMFSDGAQSAVAAGSPGVQS